MTLFAFILVLGIVVDDAIVVAERIHAKHEEGHPGLEGAILGAQEVTVPVVFGVLTTMAAFTPFMMVPGMMGNFTRAIPLIVIPVLAFSVIESQLVLPYHLSHEDRKSSRRRPNALSRFANALFAGVNDGLDWFVGRVYEPVLGVALQWRYLTAAVAIAFLMVTGGLILGGVVEWVFFPDMDSDNVVVTLTMPEETPAEITGRAVEGIERAALELDRDLEERFGYRLFRHVLTSVGEQPSANAGPASSGVAPSRAYLGEVNIELIPGEGLPESGERRPLSSAEIGGMLRERLAPIPGAVEMDVQTELMMGMGSPIDVQLSGPDVEELRVVAAEIRSRLAEYPGVIDITDTFRRGKPEIELSIKTSAESLGLSLEDVGRQVRQGFFGEEAQRIQRGPDDVRVMVRYPAEDRQSLGDLEYMRIRTSDGGQVPFGSVADAELGRGFSSIRRVDRQRAINVTADVDEESDASAWDILSELETRHMPEILASHPDVYYSLEGEQQMQDEFMGGLYQGFAVALFGIFALMAIPFRSYIQPLIVMSAVPFGLVGAVLGHAIAGTDLSFMSVMGMVAVSGVVVNDSLVLVHFVNRYVKETKHSMTEAARAAGSARFRPILLTSLTTAAGVTPLMLETSLQAQFLVPMALALASGVLFATVTTLLLVPSAYLIVEDVKKIFGSSSGQLHHPALAGTSSDSVTGA
jgi:multidrug efflux pump subunit AcrB